MTAHKSVKIANCPGVPRPPGSSKLSYSFLLTGLLPSTRQVSKLANVRLVLVRHLLLRSFICIIRSSIIPPSPTCKQQLLLQLLD